MGDPLSAATAVLSLPGVFMSCVQCFELIQAGRNFERDLLILTTKFSNQQLRFTKWGEACGFGSPDGYDRRLDVPALKPYIARTLKSVKLCLDSGVVIASTYQEQSEHNGAIVVGQSNSVRWSWKALKGQLRKSKEAPSVRDAAKWALADKKRLDEVVKHLNDLIGDLELLTRDLGVSERQRILVQYEIEIISDTETLELIEASHIDSSDMISETASLRLTSLRSTHESQSHHCGPRSMAGTESTTNTYITAQEPSTHRLDLLSLREEEPEQEDLPVLVLKHEQQNCLVMHDILRKASGDQKSHAARPIDNSSIGNLVRSFDIGKLNDALAMLSESIFREERVSTLSQRRRLLNQVRTPCNLTTGTAHYLLGSNFLYVLGCVEGPPSSPYEGGLFFLIMRIPSTYPYSPPQAKFVTRIYHPNIDSRGDICLDVLQNRWSLGFTLETTFVGIQSILDSPGLEDPLVPEIAEMYVRDRATYEANARAYTLKYAQHFEANQELIDGCIRVCTQLNEQYGSK